LTKQTYLPADSKYIDNGKLQGSENDSAAYNDTTVQSTFSYNEYLISDL